MKKPVQSFSLLFAFLFTSVLFLMGCESNQQSQNKSNLFENIGNLVRAGGIAAEGVGDPHFYEKQRQHRENEELRQAYLKRIADSNRPLTQEDIALLQQFQNQQYQQQYLNHLQRMEDLKKQEIENQKFESMRREIREGMPIYVRPDGRGGYIID
jgi:hypothetical protein